MLLDIYEPISKLKNVVKSIFITMFILSVPLIFCFYNSSFIGKIDKNITSEELSDINDIMNTTLETSLDIVESYSQCAGEGGYLHTIYIKNIGDYENFFNTYYKYPTDKNISIFKDNSNIENRVGYLQMYFSHSKLFKLDTFYPNVVYDIEVEYKNMTNNIRFYFFTEDDNSTSVIIDRNVITL